MSIGLRADANPTELVLECPSEPLAAVARLAGSGLFGDYVVYERPGSWTFAGGVLGEVVLDAGTVRTRWPGGPASARPWSARPWSARPWSGRPAGALRDAFAEAPLATWNAYGWIAFEFAAPRPSGRLAHLVVPRTEVRISAGRARVTGPDTERVAELLADADPITGAPSPVDVRVDGDAYRAKVAQAVAEIQEGRYQKVIVSRRVDIPHPVDVVATYVRGRGANTPARSFLLDLGGFQATGFSPEVLATVEADGRVMTQPLAGTRAFGAGAETDARTRRELENDPKEIFEHAVSVRTSLEELHRVCDPGTVRVTDFMTVKERGSVQHLGSRAVGALAPGRSPWEALDALFPGVTASGIPKPEAIEAITRLEDRRGMYSGAVVAASHDGALDAALVLRALYSEGGRAWLRAGAGIVSASTPDREYEETCEKLSSIAPYVVPLR